MNAIKHLAAIVVLFSLGGGFTAQANIDAKTSGLIIEKYAGRPFTSFRSFATVLYFKNEHLFDTAEHKAIGSFAADKVVSASEREVLFRLLGIYAQLKYGGDAIRSLGELVAIPTHAISGIENHKNKHFKRFQKKLRKLARKLGLNYRNVGNRVYEISIKGGSGNLVGLHAHADVAPANSKDWVLADGTQLDPFKITRIGNRLYGRGTQNNKNAIVAVMYAMRILKEERVRLWNDVKLLIDTTAETASTTMPYYLERNRTPDYNIALDGSYPVAIVERGSAIIKTVFRDPEGAWEETLLAIASENLGLDKKSGLIARDTSSQLLPNSVQFGLSMPDEEFTANSANEFKTVDQFLTDLQIVTEMLIRIGQMNNLE